jgi:nucleotide-binding universal stress UspA family protein
MNKDQQHDIVVGVSGSPASRTALSWAADEARVRHARLRVVRVWDPARHAAPYARVGAAPTCDEELGTACGGLAEAVRAEFGPVLPDHVTAELPEGVPERVLVDRSAGADLLVLGMNTPAWLTGRSPGPVVRACLARSRCPVAVIAGTSQAGPPGDRLRLPRTDEVPAPRTGWPRPARVPAPAGS